MIQLPQANIILEKQELPLFVVEKKSIADKAMIADESKREVLRSIDPSKIGGQRGSGKGQSKQYYSMEQLRGFLLRLGIEHKSSDNKATRAEKLLNYLETMGIDVKNEKKMLENPK